MLIALATIGIIAGIVLIGGGSLTTYSGMMSDAPTEGTAMSNKGCAVVIAGIVLLVGSILALVL